MGQSQEIIARINLRHLRHNLETVRKLAPDSQIMTVIKANAYGHGMKEVSLALKSADAQAVARVSEALMLRQAGVGSPLLVLAGALNESDVQLALEYDLQLVLHSHSQYQMINSVVSGRQSVRCWLKIDTGMNRLGLSREEFFSLVEKIKADGRKKIVIEAIMTHFACADEKNNDMTSRQIKIFDEITAGLEYPQSLANSAGIMGWKESLRDWVRPGLMLYGFSPFDNMEPDPRLKPVMTLQAPLLAVKQVRKGESVGYGASFICEKESIIGLVAAGYGDGYSRWMPTGTPVLVDNRMASLVGRVSMDMIAIDVTEFGASLKPGTPVTLFGEGLPAEILSKVAGTIPYIFTTNLTARVKREYLE